MPYVPGSGSNVVPLQAPRPSVAPEYKLMAAATMDQMERLFETDTLTNLDVNRFDDNKTVQQFFRDKMDPNKPNAKRLKNEEQRMEMNQEIPRDEVIIPKSTKGI